ncbi:MAG: hypothetical protein ACREQX_10695, partial [Candidatus Binataceae bacterium]
MASFAGDADALGQALKKGDATAASSSLNALSTDRAAVDSALTAHPKALNLAQWGALKSQLATLINEVPRVPDGAMHSGAPPASSPRAGAGSRGNLVGPAPSSNSQPPRIVIRSRVREGDTIHIEGYLEGNALKSAGIWNHGEEVKDFRVGGVPGRQRVNFKLAIEQPGPSTRLRVTDVHGRAAQASLLNSADADSGLDASGSSLDVAPPLPAPEIPDSAAHSSGGEVAVIPSHGPVRPSPSKRHTIGGRLGDVQINITGLTELSNLPSSYEVAGEISGKGVTRAGIYVHGRLAARIPITHGANFSSFDTRFTSNRGQATIRAYGIGDQFVENSLDLTNASMASADPVMTAPAGMAIQIISVRQAAAGLYVVTGMISGRRIVSAGLYQNGMLTQAIPLHGSLLGAIIPGAAQRFSFSARFNPYRGEAVVRAFDSSGEQANQPVMVATNPYAAGMTPMNPYAINPYGAPRVNPYFSNP